MTVLELIGCLEEQDPDAEVTIPSPTGGDMVVDNVDKELNEVHLS